VRTSKHGGRRPTATTREVTKLSFRGRLTAFFVAIVVLPMIAVAVLAVRVTEDSGDGESDAMLAASLEASVALYDEALAGGPKDIARIADSPRGRLGAGRR